MTGLRFKLARIKRGLKQLELARLTGITPTRLSLIENGWIEPKAEEVIALCNELDLKKEDELGKDS